MSLCPGRLTPKIGDSKHQARANSARRSTGGTGKGLLIVDDLVDTGNYGHSAVNSPSCPTIHVTNLPARPIKADVHQNGSNSVAPKRRFVHSDQRDLPCPVWFAKRFRFARRANQTYKLRRPVPGRGALAIVTNVGRDAVDAVASCVKIDRRAGLP
jgi:hypothetical protein